MDLLEVSPQDFTVKRAATYLKSKAVVLGTRITQDELERAIFKTTSSKNKVPNPKHLKRLIYTSYSSCPSGSQLVNHSTSISTDHEGEEQSNLHMTTDELVARLEKRLHTHDWVVTLKTLIVFHYLLRDGSVELHNAIVHHTSLFHVTKVKDFATADYGRCFSRFITGYTRYMEERCACMRTLQLRVPMDRQRRMEEGDFISSMFQGLSFEKTIEAVGAMLVQLSALITMDIEVPVEENPVALCSLQLIVSDSKRLIAIISDRCVYLLDHASSLTGSNRLAARHTLLEYHKRCRETNFFYGKVTSMMQRCLTSHRQENPIDIYRTLSHSSAENANDTGDVELEPIMLLPTIKEIPIEEIERIFDEQAVQTNTVCKETPSSSLPANGNQCTIAPDIPNHETISLEDFLAKAEEHSKAKEMPGDVFSNVQNLTMQNFAQPSSTISAVQERIEFCNQIAIPTNTSSNNTIQNNSGVSKYAELDAFF